MQTYLEKTKSLPVIFETDVLVVGGGPAGIGAALAAQHKIAIRNVDIREVQKLLMQAGIQP